jgi:DNA topoisomerase-2
MSPIEHILKRPDTYIGSTSRQSESMWVWDDGTESMKFQSIEFVPGLYKIFDEVLVNATDNY